MYCIALFCFVLFCIEQVRADACVADSGERGLHDLVRRGNVMPVRERGQLLGERGHVGEPQLAAAVPRVPQLHVRCDHHRLRNHHSAVCPRPAPSCARCLMC